MNLSRQSIAPTNNNHERYRYKNDATSKKPQKTISKQPIYPELNFSN